MVRGGGLGLVLGLSSRRRVPAACDGDEANQRKQEHANPDIPGVDEETGESQEAGNDCHDDLRDAKPPPSREPGQETERAKDERRPERRVLNEVTQGLVVVGNAESEHDDLPGVGGTVGLTTSSYFAIILL